MGQRSEVIFISILIYLKVLFFLIEFFQRRRYWWQGTRYSMKEIDLIAHTPNFGCQTSLKRERRRKTGGARIDSLFMMSQLRQARENPFYRFPSFDLLKVRSRSDDLSSPSVTDLFDNRGWFHSDFICHTGKERKYSEKEPMIANQTRSDSLPPSSPGHIKSS